MTEEYTIQITYSVTLERTIKSESMQDALEIAQTYADQDAIDNNTLRVSKAWTSAYSSGEVSGVFK